MDRRARVVDEPRQRQLGGAGPTPDGVRRLVDPDRPPGPRELDRGGEPVGPGADDDRVEGGRHLVASTIALRLASSSPVAAGPTGPVP